MVAVCGIDPGKIETRLFINNEFVNAKSGKTFNAVDPSTEEVICSVHQAGKEEIEAAVRTQTQPRQEDRIGFACSFIYHMEYNHIECGG